MSNTLIAEIINDTNIIDSKIRKVAVVTKEILEDRNNGRDPSSNLSLQQRYFETVRNKLFLKVILTDYEFFAQDIHKNAY
jgi:hypothetical protein